MKNLYCKKLKEILIADNRFIFADIDFSKNTIGSDTIWEGFQSKREIRGPRIGKLLDKHELKKWEAIGFDVIVFDAKSSIPWVNKGAGRGIFHISYIKEYFPSILQPSPTLESVEQGGFYAENSEVGRKLARKRLSPTERQKLIEEFQSRCFICKSTKDLTVHHIKDRQFGGGSERLNSVPICQECHEKINKKEIDHMLLHVLRYRVERQSSGS